MSKERELRLVGETPWYVTYFSPLTMIVCIITSIHLFGGREENLLLLVYVMYLAILALVGLGYSHNISTL